MAQCVTCGAGILPGATRCLKCGAAIDIPTQPVVQSQPVQPQQVQNQPVQVIIQQTASSKSRSVYILLGVILGALGIHNFYAGYAGRGIAQLLISVVSLGFLAVVSWVWAIIEVCTVTTDSSGQPFS